MNGTGGKPAIVARWVLGVSLLAGGIAVLTGGGAVVAGAWLVFLGIFAVPTVVPFLARTASFRAGDRDPTSGFLRVGALMSGMLSIGALGTGIFVLIGDTGADSPRYSMLLLLTGAVIFGCLAYRLFSDSRQGQRTGDSESKGVDTNLRDDKAV